MDRRDLELLDKQLWGVSPHPPGNGGILGFAALALFCAGVAIGSLVFPHTARQPQMSWRAAVAHLSQDGALPAGAR